MSYGRKWFILCEWVHPNRSRDGSLALCLGTEHGLCHSEHKPVPALPWTGQKPMPLYGLADKAKEGKSVFVQLCTKTICLRSPWGHGWFGGFQGKGSWGGAGEGLLCGWFQAMMAGDVNGCGWSALIKANWKWEIRESFICRLSRCVGGVLIQPLRND